MSLPSFQADRAKWMYYMLKAHLAIEAGGMYYTACNRRLQQMDEPVGEVVELHKCDTCRKFEQRGAKQ